MDIKEMEKFWKLMESDSTFHAYISGKLNEGLKVEETVKNLQKAEEELKVEKESLATVTKERDEYRTKCEESQTELSAFKAKEATDKRKAFIAGKLSELKVEANQVYPDLIETWEKMESEEKVIESINKFVKYLQEKNVGTKGAVVVPAATPKPDAVPKATNYLEMDNETFKKIVL